MEMKDMGQQVPDYGGIEATSPAKPKKTITRYPSFYIDGNVPEELMSKDIGHTCRVMIEVEVISKGMDQREGQDNRGERLELKVKKLGYVSSGGKKSKDEYMAMDETSRDAYDKEQMESSGDENQAEDQGEQENE